MNIGGLEFVMTCSCCPEQYDVFDIGQDIKQVGYVRLRHGWITAAYPDYGGTLVYSADVKGDGMFVDDEERMKTLRLIAALLQSRIAHDESKISKANEVVERLMDAIGNSDVGVFVRVPEGDDHWQAVVSEIYVDESGDVIVEVR